MKTKGRAIPGTVAIAIFGTMAFLNFNKAVAPYVPFAEARASSGTVQVSGFPDHRGASFDMKSGEFRFTMKDDEGDRMTVAYKGPQPGNFDQAEKVVVIGNYHEGTFEASQILVKCPSKYDDEAVPEAMKEAMKNAGS